MVLVRPEDNKISRETTGQDASIKVKTPKRILHFCDGTLEEYSTDEEDNVNTSNNIQPTVDPSSLAWGPWFVYKAWAAGSSTLSVIDTMGEYLASAFGITTPRYYFEIEEYKRRQAHDVKERESALGWSRPSNSSISVPLKEMSRDSRPIDV